MKTTKFFMLAALAGAAVFTSCNGDDEVTNNEPVAVQFSAAIDGQVVANGPRTRAASTAWEANDEIGIFMVDNNTTDIRNYANKRYTVKADGETANFEAADGKMYYPTDVEKVDFIAYYPYVEGADFSTFMQIGIGTEQTAESQPGFDLLWTTTYPTKSTGYDKYTNPVEFKFDHVMSKLVMNVVAGTGVAQVSNLSVRIEGMYTQNKFDVGNGSWMGAYDQKATITPRTITPDASYDAIILPNQYGDEEVKVKFEMDGDTYTWSVPGMVFIRGYEHTYTVKLQKTGENTSVTATGTINPWDEEDEGEVEAHN